MRLREVFFLLNSDWNEEKKELMMELQAQGICCRSIDKIEELLVQKSVRDSRKKNVSGNRDSQKEILLITDDQSAAARCKGKIVCIGCDREGVSFFEGAELVTDRLEMLDGQVLEETLCHVHGYPVTIAETERLIIREIAKSDFEGLRAMSGQDGMQHAFAEFAGEAACDAGMFDPERLAAYISQVYRFYGYGLWSVLKKDGTLIGCCGLAEFEKQMCVDKSGTECEAARRADKTGAEHGTTESAEADVGYAKEATNTCLELQYMLAAEFQGQGYAQEMCRAALRYAAWRTDWDKVWIRVHKSNEKSQRLAKRLGFSMCGDENGEIIFYVMEIAGDAF